MVFAFVSSSLASANEFVDVVFDIDAELTFTLALVSGVGAVETFAPVTALLLVAVCAITLVETKSVPPLI